MMISSGSRRFPWLWLPGLLLLISTPVLAQSPSAQSPSAQRPPAQSRAALEEIVVTAQRREASLQDTPISVAAFGGADLEKLGIHDLGDIQFNVPNLSMRQFPNSQAALRIFIRGIGNNDVQLSQDPAVSVYLDGLYIARSTGLASEIVDPQRIEVLRGPQGTLFGRNTTGGAINIVSTPPGGEFALRQTLTAGNFNQFRSRTDLDLPQLFNQLSIKLSHVQSHIDGTVKNRGVGPDFGEERKRGTRLALRWDPTANLTLDYSYDRTDNEIGAFYYQTIGAPKQGYEDVPHARKRMSSATPSHPFEKSTLRIDGHSLIAEWAISPQHTLKLLTGQRKLDDQIYQDYSANPNTPRLFANDPFDTRHRQFSQELQMLGSFLDGQLSYVTGVYYFRESGAETTTDFLTLAVDEFTAALIDSPPLTVGVLIGEELSSRFSRARNEAEAVYGELTWSPDFLDRRWHFTLGWRTTRDKREAEGSRTNGFWGTVSEFEEFEQVEVSKKFSNNSPAFIVAWDIVDNASVYAKYARGYKTGGFNLRAVTENSFRNPFDEEIVTTLEAGLKSEWLQQRLRFNMAIFDSAYEDKQESFAAANNPADVTFFNAGEASIRGIEADLTAVPLQGLILTLNYAYLDHELTKVINPETGVDEGANFILPSAPDQSYTADISYRRPLTGGSELLLNLNYSWRDRIRSASNVAETPEDWIESYGLLSARAGISSVTLNRRSTLDIAVWGKNLADKEYLLDAIGAFPWSGRTGAFGTPRTYGVDITLRF